MTPDIRGQELPRAQILAEKTFESAARFLHIEAVSGLVLLLAAALALAWANSTFGDSYHALWHAPMTFGLGSREFSQPLHFWINDGLMTLFFLVVGMEIRREIHEGALSDARQASLPLAAALGGVVVPALVYLSFNTEPYRQAGWAVPTATDIAFAVGVLALLGRSIPGSLRVFLLALAIIDDVIAVLIIALFYSGGLDYAGFVPVSLGLLIVLALQRIGVGSAFAYVLPGALVWLGMLQTGAHPTLAGVLLGLLTPVRPVRLRERPLRTLPRIAGELLGPAGELRKDVNGLPQQLRQLRKAQREILPPVVRVQTALHPWVAYAVMPLFALANAGVVLGGGSASVEGEQWIMIGVLLALTVGKPLGILGASWLVVRLGYCRLPPGLGWGGIALVALLAGIGFTMSIFIATLAFADESLLNAAKRGVLLASGLSALFGLGWGYCHYCLRGDRNHHSRVSLSAKVKGLCFRAGA